MPEPKLRVPEIVLGIVLTVAIFAMGMLFDSSRQQPSNNHTQPRTDKTVTETRPEPFSWDWFTHDGAAFFTAVLAFIAVIQAGLFVWQLRYMRRGMNDAALAAKAASDTAQATRDQIELAFRPKIRIKHLWLTTDIWAGERLEATIVFVNSGTADAILREMGSATCMVDEGETLPTDPNYAKRQTLPMSGQVLPPGISVEIKDLNDRHDLSDAENVAIREGKARLFWVGFIEYEDRRHAIRKTSFCRVLKLPAKITVLDRGRFVKYHDSDYEYED